MNTKKLRALAETVMNSEARWRMDALSLARAVLAEVPEASQVDEAPWVGPLRDLEERLARLEEARLDRPEPTKPDPLESAKAHVAEWPAWKVAAAREQLPTQDMHGKPMPSPIVTANAPAGFEVVSEPYVVYQDQHLTITAPIAPIERPKPSPVPTPTAPAGFEVVSEPYVYGRTAEGRPMMLILASDWRVHTITGDGRQLLEGEHWLAPIGRPRP